jgi:hypothetical protein
VSPVTFADEVLASDVELPELAAAPAGAPETVRVVREDAAELHFPPSDTPEWLDADGGCTFAVEPVAIVRISARADAVHVRCPPATAPAMVRHVVLDHALPRVLAVRGRVVLHATAVDLGGRAVGVLAASGTGKSTLAAAAVRAGGRWLADDCLLLDERGTHVVVEPTFTGTRLFPDSSSVLDLPPDAGEAMEQAYAKRRWAPEATGPRAEAGVPLGALVVLARTDDPAPPTITTLSGAQTLVALVQHRFLAAVLPPARLLADAARLHRLVPVHRLTVPSSLARLDDAVDALITALPAAP